MIAKNKGELLTEMLHNAGVNPVKILGEDAVIGLGEAKFSGKEDMSEYIVARAKKTMRGKGKKGAEAAVREVWNMMATGYKPPIKREKRDFDGMFDTLVKKVLGEDNDLSEANAKNPYAKIAKMTDYNDHAGAILAGAELLGSKDIAARIKLVSKLHDLEGSIPSSLIDYRYSLHKELKALAKKKLSSDDYDQFCGAF